MKKSIILSVLFLAVGTMSAQVPSYLFEEKDVAAKTFPVLIKQAETRIFPEKNFHR
jgi:hypothetical protein